MAEEVQIISTLDNKQTLGALSQTEKAVNDNAKAVETLNTTNVEMFNNIVKESKLAQRTLKDLTEESERLTEAIENTARGTDEYNRLKQELIGVNKEIKNVELSFEALDSEQVASEVGSVVGGLTDVASGAFLAFGVAEESAEEFFKTLAQVEGAGRLVKGSIEGLQSAQKLYNNVLKNGKALQLATVGATNALGVAQSIYTSVVGTSTGALKLFRLALIGTGIGAIVVAIGLLIENFDKVKEVVGKVVDSFLPLKLAIEGIMFLLQELGIIQSEQEQRAIASAEARVESLKEEQSAIGDKFDFEIAKAKASGKNTFELEQKKRKAVLENLKAQAEAIVALVKLTGEFTDEQKEQLQEIGKLAKKLSQERKVAEIANAKESADKAREERKKANDKAQKEAEEQAKKLNAIAQELTQLRINSIEDETERELAKLDDKFDARIMKLKEGGEKEIELAVALEKEKARLVAEVEEKARKDKEAKEEEARILKKENEDLLKQTEVELLEAQAQDEIAKLEAKKQADRLAEQQAFDQKIADLQERGLLTQELEAEIEEARQLSLQGIEDRFREEKALKEEEFKQNEINREAEKRDAKIAVASTTANALSSISQSLDEEGVGSAKLAKTLAVAQIAINTAQAISGAIKAGAGVPFPGNIPAILTGVSAVLAGMVSAKKALAQSKIPGGGVGGTFTLPSVGAGGGGGAPIPSTPTLPLTGGTGAGSESDTQTAGSSQIVKAFVVETEITDAQANAKTIEEKSELT